MRDGISNEELESENVKKVCKFHISKYELGLRR